MGASFADGPQSATSRTRSRKHNAEHLLLVTVDTAGTAGPTRPESAAPARP